jgi:Flp pilus assembly protein TadG
MKPIRFNCQKGAAAVEFAIVLPLLLMLLFGIIEFSVILYDKAMITNASREGTRAGIVYRWPAKLTEGEIKTVVTNYAKNYLISLGSGSPPLTAGDIQVTGAGGPEGSPLTVRVNYQYTYLVIPNFVAAITGPLNLAAETVMRME